MPGPKGEFTLFPPLADPTPPPSGVTSVNGDTGPAVVLDAVDVGALAAFPGMMMMYGGAAAPTGWLLCDGASYATATYPALFAAIGYAFGGAGANFNVPDLRDKFPKGANGDLGTAVAAATHTHGDGTYAVASHVHGMNSHTHGVGTYAVGSHSHTADGTLAVASHTHTGPSHTHGGDNLYACLSWGSTNIWQLRTSDSFISTRLVAHGGGDTADFTSRSSATAIGGTTGADGTGNTGAASPDVTGSTSSTTPSFTGASAAATGDTAATAPDVTGSSGATTAPNPANQAVNFIIKT